MKEGITLRDLAYVSAILVGAAAIVAPVLVQTPVKARTLDQVRQMENSLAIYSHSYDYQLPSLVAPDLRPVYTPSSDKRSDFTSPGARQISSRQDALDLDRMRSRYTKDELLAVSSAFMAQPVIEPSRMEVAYDTCGLYLRFPYEIPLEEDDPDGCFEVAKEFMLDPEALCALVFAEASLYSLGKDTVQNTLASLAINPSGGLKQASHTTIGVAQMAPETAKQILDKLQVLGPHYYERLGVPEGEEDIEEWLMVQLASDWRLGIQMQAGYAYVNLHPWAETSEVAGSTFDKFVREVYNPINPELHARWTCLYTELGGSLPITEPSLELEPPAVEVQP